MVGIVLSRMGRWWLKVDEQCACLLCVDRKLWKGTQPGDKESSTRDCMIKLTELVAAIVKGCVGIHLHQIRWVSSHYACRRLCYRTPRFSETTNAEGNTFPSRKHSKKPHS